jgi:hypothetical protein
MMPLRKEKKKNFVQNKGVGRQACCARRNNWREKRPWERWSRGIFGQHTPFN